MNLFNLTYTLFNKIRNNKVDCNILISTDHYQFRVCTIRENVKATDTDIYKQDIRAPPMCIQDELVYIQSQVGPSNRKDNI